MSATSAPVCFRIMPPRVRHGWLPYFLAAVGAGPALADEAFLRYWWVMPDAPAEKAPRVIRVLGEKGERFEEVYAAETRAELKSEPAILRARLARGMRDARKFAEILYTIYCVLSREKYQDIVFSAFFATFDQRHFFTNL